MKDQKRSEIVNLVANLLSSLSEEERLSIAQKIQRKDSIPLSAFNSTLSALEVLIQFLKEQGWEFPRITTFLQRNRNTIYTTYKKGQKKKQKLDLSSHILLPLSLFSNRDLSVLEAIISHLKEEHHMKLVDIARHLGKSNSTVKTIYWRYKKK